MRWLLVCSVSDVGRMSGRPPCRTGRIGRRSAHQSDHNGRLSLGDDGQRAETAPQEALVRLCAVERRPNDHFRRDGNGAREPEPTVRPTGARAARQRLPRPPPGRVLSFDPPNWLPLYCFTCITGLATARRGDLPPTCSVRRSSTRQEKRNTRSTEITRPFTIYWDCRWPSLGSLSSYWPRALGTIMLLFRANDVTHFLCRFRHLQEPGVHRVLPRDRRPARSLRRGRGRRLAKLGESLFREESAWMTRSHSER